MTLAPSTEVVPRQLTTQHDPADRIFHGATRTVALFVLCLIGAVGVFLGLQAIPTIQHYGFHFFTQTQWQPELNKIGIAAVLVGTVEVALVAMVVSFPLAVGLALFITDYAPPHLKSWLVSAVDVMAAVPSIIYGIWGFYLLEPHAIQVARWLSEYLGFIPIFKVDTDTHAAVWQQSQYTGSVFVAGLVVAMMATPLACAVMRGVFDQTPVGEREGALALGGTRWGAARMVVFPFARGGIIGGSMLALGRALGETAAVLIIVAPDFIIKPRILETGAQTISELIASDFGNSTPEQLKALLTAGFVLFLITLAVNSAAAFIIRRSRNAAQTEI